MLPVPAASEAASIVIDFNSAATGNFGSLIVGDFRFDWVGFGDIQQVRNIGPGNNALADSVLNVFGAETTMSRVGGGTFTVTQFDLVNLTNPAGGGSFRVDFGGVSYNGPATQTVPRGDLVNVSSLLINIVSNSQDFAVDNIHVDYTPAVPEPASFGLVLTGLAALGRKRIVQQFRRTPGISR